MNPEFQYELKHTAHEILAGVVLRNGVHMGICSGGLGRSEASVKEKWLSARISRIIPLAFHAGKAYEDIELAEIFH